MRNRKLRSVLARLISSLPFNRVRSFFYRVALGYQIDGAYIGRGVVIDVDMAKLLSCSIGSRSRFIGPIRITVREGARIGGDNTFICGRWVEDERYNEAKYSRELIIERNSLITSHHYFDVAGSFVLGEGSWVAGVGSQFWTHGAGVSDRNIQIGQNCYIGSAVRFSPGSSIGDNTLVGIGSVVTKKFSDEYVFIAGCPAKILKDNYDWRVRVM